MPINKRIVCLVPALFFLLLSQTLAQKFIVKGQVVDYDTHEPLAFVSLQANGGTEGCISDIDGKFLLRSSTEIKKINFSYIGYDPVEFVVSNNSKDVVVPMRKTAYQLSEVVIKPGANPANNIIRKVIANRYINDHEHLPSFSYTSYEKMVFGPESDSIPHIDSLASDSSYIRAKEYFSKRHLFMMESVVKRSFKFPNDNYNKVVASRVSGLSDPLFVFLISQLQSTTFYKEVIKVMDKDYINPISNGCFSKYYFKLQDTLVEPYPYDTTYIISFRPLFKTNFDGLKGTISISTNGYAIRNVIALPAKDEGLISVKIQQMYDFIDSTHWFPIQLNTDLIFKNTAIVIDSTKKTQLKMMGRGKSYISEINLNPKLRRDQFGAVEVDVLPDAYTKSDKIWNRYRADSLSIREQKTYEYVDSIGKAQNFDKYGRRLDAMMNGKVNLGYFDLYLDQILGLNNHEGFRLGAKVATSDKLLSWFKLGGYGAYGFKDKKFKYGSEGTFVFDRFRNFFLRVGFSDDVEEAGAYSAFETEKTQLNQERFREILIQNMDHTRFYNAKLSSRLLKYMTLSAEMASYTKEPLYNYRYITYRNDKIIVTQSDFSFSELGGSLRYAYGEKLLKNAKSIVSLGTHYPIIHLYAVHGFDNLFGGQYTYSRFDLKITKSTFIKYIGTTSINLWAGFIDRDLPAVNLYNGRPSYRLFTLYSPGSFATMRMGEFAADRYASVFFSHNFGKLLFRSKHFKPEPELVTNLGIGTLKHPENHLLDGKTGLKSYEKGYFESGLIINKIFRLGVSDIGFGWMYRYGPYAFPAPKDNMAWKISIQFILTDKK